MPASPLHHNSRLDFTPEQRDALYDQILDRLSGIGDIEVAIRSQNYEAAERLDRLTDVIDGHRASIITNSWDSNESAGGNIPAYEALFQQAAACGFEGDPPEGVAELLDGGDAEPDLVGLHHGKHTSTGGTSPGASASIWTPA